MKKLLFVLLVSWLLLSASFANVFDDMGGWYNNNFDKVSHGLLGATTAGYALKHLASPETAILDSGLMGIVKECFDSQIGKPWDINDAVATLVGGVLLVVL